jgi:hypothetical protein
LIETNDTTDREVTEDGEIVVGSEGSEGTRRMRGEQRRGWRGEGDESVGYDDVEVTVLYVLEVFILVHVERVGVEQAVTQRSSERLDTVEGHELVSVRTDGRVTEWGVRLERLQCVIGV